jgi:tRNA threonylcarbamoyladenosine biosynthesis protein TsaB
VNLLALDTATAVTSVALLTNQRALCSRLEPSKSHSTTLLPLIDTLLAQAGWGRRAIEAVAVGIGPGSFTGVRIGLTVAKTLAYALAIPLVGISSLRALAENALALPNVDELEVCPILDALKNEIYSARFTFVRSSATATRTAVLDAEAAVQPAQFAKRLAEGTARVLLLGNGLTRYRDIFTTALGNRAVIPDDMQLHQIQAAALGSLAFQRLAVNDTDSPHHLEPLYCRLSEAELARLRS